MPSASMRQAIVDAVPIVLQWPLLRIVADSESRNASGDSVPARTSSRTARTSAAAPTSPASPPSSAARTSSPSRYDNPAWVFKARRTGSNNNSPA